MQDDKLKIYKKKLKIICIFVLTKIFYVYIMTTILSPKFISSFAVKASILLLCLFIASHTVHSQITAIRMDMEWLSSTTNTADFQIRLTNTGTSAVTFNALIIRGVHAANLTSGTITWKALNDNTLPGWLNWPNTGAANLPYISSQRKLNFSSSNGIFTSATAQAIPSGAGVVMGTFRMSTTTTWVPNSDFGFVWEMTSGGVVGYVDGATFVTNIQHYGVSGGTVCGQCLTVTASSAQPLNVGGVVPPITASVLSVSSANNTICSGASTNLSAVVTGGNPPYTVTVTDGTNNYSATGTSPVSIPVNPTTTSTFTIVSVSSGSVTGTGNSGSPTVTVTAPALPTFTQVAAVCIGATINSLPTSSTNNITGTWSPVINNTSTTTYTFTPQVGQCATTQTMNIVISQNTTPTFSQVGPFCSGVTISPLPISSTNGISGTWSPAINNSATTTYTFTPTTGICATTQTMSIAITQSILPNFMQVGPFCSGATISPLPISSTNDISGTWTPAINNLATTTYTFTPTAGLCATTQTMSITITPNTTNNISIITCESSYFWGVTGQTYTAPGIYIGPTVNCITKVLNLTFITSSINTTSISTCETYTWANNGLTYNSSGTYYGTTTNCVTEALSLTILAPTSIITTPVSACGASYTWSNNGQTYTASGIYSGITGSDCIGNTLNLTLSPSLTSSVSQAACESYTWENTGQTYTTSGIYTGNVVNCITPTLNLTISPSSTNSTNITSCGSYTWPNNGQTFTSSGVYTGSTTNCVTQVLNLTISAGATTTTPLPTCGSYTWATNGETYDSSGTYISVNSCGTDTLNLTIYPSNNNQTDTIVCGTSYFWSETGATYTTTGIYEGPTNIEVGQCYTEILNLTILPPNTINTINITACDSYTWANTGQTYTEIGTNVYPGSILNCVTEILNLSIIPSSTNTTTVSVCDSYTWANNGITYTSSGNYTGNTSECITEILNLTIIPTSINTTTVSGVCASYTWANTGQTYLASGTYTGTITNCVTEVLNLSITPNTTNTTNANACGSYLWANNNQTYTVSGTYTGPTVNCVTPTLILTITPNSTNTTTVSAACGSYAWSNTGITYTSTGVYPGNTLACITQSLNLTIIPNTSVTTTITAIDTYTWVANGLTYTTSGIYTGPTSANCVTQYLNLTINSSGISEEELVLFSLYPNPVSDMLYVNLNVQDKQEYLIIDNFGSVVKRGVLENMSTEISVSELSAGLYYFKIEGTKPRKFSKIN
jgi:hypothetical protein